MNFDLSDWERRKAALYPVLDAAANEGILAREQTLRMAEFLLGRGVGMVAAPQAMPTSDGEGLDTPLAAEPVSSLEDSEAPRFIRGFHDILITIGIIVGLLGLVGLATVYAVIPATIVLAEILVRRQRLALPAVVLTIAFAMSSATAIFPLFSSEGEGEKWVFVAVLATGFIVSALFYWRYRVPLALATALVGLFATLVFAAAPLAMLVTRNQDLFKDHPGLLALYLAVFAVLVFATALRFDFADRHRVTRRSDVAFWMHLAAAPAMLYSVLALVYLNEENWLGAGSSLYQAGVIVAAVLVLMLIGIVLDRRAFVTSGLLSFGYAFKILLSEGGFEQMFKSTDTILFVILLSIGVLVLGLGIGWQALRRVVVGLLPQALIDVVPPVKR